MSFLTNVQITPQKHKDMKKQIRKILPKDHNSLSNKHPKIRKWVKCPMKNSKLVKIIGDYKEETNKQMNEIIQDSKEKAKVVLKS